MIENNYIQRPGLNVRAIDDETVIVDKDTGEVHQLNATASFIWEQFGQQSSLTQVAKSVAQFFGIDSHQADVDVQAVVDQLLQLKLLEPGSISTDTGQS